jgi:hypothetical protein
MEGSGGIFDPLTILRRQPALRTLFSAPSLHTNDRDLGLFPGNQSIIHIGLVKGKKGFCQSVVSNCSSDIQKLFLVIRDGNNNIMYKIR